MEKLDKVIAGMEACNGVGDDCNSCPYAGEGEKCSGVLWADALEWLKRYYELDADNQRLREMWAEATKNLSIAIAERDEHLRCAECSYWDKAVVNKKGFLICPASGMEIMADDFCSYGERKTE